jgi:integrase
VVSSAPFWVILIIGISGVMRRDELTKKSIDDIQDENSVLIVTVPDTKTGINRTLTVTNSDFVRLHRKHADRHVVSVIINYF